MPQADSPAPATADGLQSAAATVETLPHSVNRLDWGSRSGGVTNIHRGYRGMRAVAAVVTLIAGSAPALAADESTPLLTGGNSRHYFSAAGPANLDSGRELERLAESLSDASVP